MGFYLGIDLGTSYFKAGVFDENGNLKGLGRQFVKKEVGDGSICELPVPVFWGTLRACIGEAVQKSGISPKEITAVSYSSQANSFILLDENDKPLTPLILWPDKRAGEPGQPMEGFPDKKEFLKKTGLGIDLNGEFAIAKIIWFQKKQPEIWRRVKSILTISDYLTFMLTGQKVSDYSTASLTGLFDVVECRWWGKSLELFSLLPEFFPVPQRTGSHAGALTKSGAQLIGLNQGAGYYLGGLDHHCAAIGSGIIQNDYICESTGTVLSCVGYSGVYSPKVDCCVAPGVAAGEYFRMAFDDNGAFALEWYRKNFAPAQNIPELLELAKKVSAGSEGLIAKPCANRYEGQGGFENVQPCHGHGHFVRAILESTADSLAGLILKVSGPGYSGGIVSTGGGARSSFWVKIKAEKTGMPFYTHRCRETACLGAAMIGAKGSVKVTDWNELAEHWVKLEKIEMLV